MHDLRHLGAVNFLDQQHQDLKAHGVSIDTTEGSAAGKLDSLALDPLDALRRRLGHSNLDTTFIYLQLAQDRRRTKTPGIPSLWDMAMGEEDDR